MARRPLIAGNWKMHLTLAEAVELGRAVANSSADCPDRDVMIAPAFTALSTVAEAVRASSVQIAAQNVAWEEQGAFTGEISPVMLKEAGAVMAIVGHSERRSIFGEDDQLVNQRVRGALAFGLVPVFCLGETLDDRETGDTFIVLEKQLRAGFSEVSAAQAGTMVVAYEPVWAIGTGKTATKEQAQEVHVFLRELLARIYDKSVAEQIRILYGGSVKPDNVDSLMAQPDIDGALVGGAALQPESFDRIIHFS
ncbi:MAG: triose-phosphate isomerase [Desulfobulbus propionicus]|nr:MAG: triose-phosphate isomerase [Desulfobulbus propionicus]